MSESETVSTQLPADHSISIVVPVYQGERTLAGLMDEIKPLTSPQITTGGHSWVVGEVLLVNDNGPDNSAAVMRMLSKDFSFVRPVWLSRNFGQHAATLAGMASAGGDWVVTLDEDGQHDPSDIGALLDAAMERQSPVVYAKALNEAPHGFLRNSASKTAKWMLAKVSGTTNASEYSSFRLVLGNIARSVAAYAGSGVYLDVALGWVSNRIATAPVTLREEGDRRSGYSPRRLFGHFLRMVLTSGTRALRAVAILGFIIGIIGIIFAIVVLIERVVGDIAIAGWASTVVIVLLSSGAILFSLGVVAEYIGINVNMAMGKPPYLITTDPDNGPLGRPPRVTHGR
ncbi:glycosyltransferase [Rathayibacter sp. KR2-224]|uniref:glycosyltransferase n=1 Tax=Rathayibacter sp. KR2-224 TaxID=3400913 RepID=UPI003BFC4C05